MKELFDKLSGANKDTMDGLFKEKIPEAARELASPVPTGRAEDLEKNMDEFTQSRAETYQKISRDYVQDKVKSKIDELGEEPEEPEGEKSDVVPILGLKSADRQRQESLNTHR